MKGTDGLTNRERRKMADKYRREVCRELTSEEKVARMKWLTEKLKEENN